MRTNARSITESGPAERRLRPFLDQQPAPQMDWRSFKELHTEGIQPVPSPATIAHQRGLATSQRRKRLPQAPVPAIPESF